MGSKYELDPISRRKLLQTTAIVAGGVIFAPILSSCNFGPTKKEPGQKSELAKSLEIATKGGGYLYVEGLRSEQTGILDTSGLVYVGKDNERVVLRDPDIEKVHSYAFSTSGEQLGFVVTTKNSPRVVLKIVDLTNNQEVVLEGAGIIKDKSQDPRQQKPTWSYNESLVYSPSQDAVWDIKTGKLILDDLNKNVKNASILGHPFKTWSPTRGEMIVRDKGSGSISIISFENGGKSTRKICSDAVPETAFWTGNGEQIIVRTCNKPVVFTRLDRNGKKIKEVMITDSFLALDGGFSSSGNYYLDYSKDGSSIYFKDSDEDKGTWFFLPKTGQSFPLGDIINLPNDKFLLTIPNITDTRLKLVIISAEDLLNKSIDFQNGNYGKNGSFVDIEVADAKNVIVRDDREPYFLNQVTLEMHQRGSVRTQEVIRVNLKTKKADMLGAREGVVLQPDVGISVKTKEKEPAFSSGDILKFGNKFYFIRNEMVYEIPDLNKFKERARIARNPITISSAQFSVLQQGQIPQADYIEDYFGMPKANRSKTGGGRRIMWGPGLGTNSQNETSVGFDKQAKLQFSGTFISARERFKPKGWGFTDETFISYNRSKEQGYSIWDTMKDPSKAIKAVAEQIKEFGEKNPLMRLNINVHSLGGPIVFWAILEGDNLSHVDTLSTIDSPLKGIPPDLRGQAISLISNLISFETLEYLLAIGADQSYQKRLKEGAQRMKKEGIRLYTFASKDDRVVPWQSAYLEGSEDKINGKKIDLVYSYGCGNNEDLLLCHGRPLDHPKLLGYIVDIQGENKAA